MAATVLRPRWPMVPAAPRLQYARKVLATKPIAYWPLNEQSGAVARCLVNPAQNGTYVGVDLGQPGIGDGWTAPYFDGANDYCNVYSIRLRDTFPYAIGSLMVWFRMAEGAWADATDRQVLSFREGGANGVYVWKSPNVGRLILRFRSTTGILSSIINGNTSTDWMNAIMTWSLNTPAAGGAAQHYLDGIALNPPPDASIERFGLVDSIYTCIGALYTAPSQVMHGHVAHCAVWSKVLSAAEVAYLSRVR